MMIATHWGTGQSDGAVIEQLLTMNEVLRSEKEELIEQLDELEGSVGLKQAEAMRHVAKWLSGEIEEGCIGLDLGCEISGPTGCSSADRCRVAGERIFIEAARIWEWRHNNQS